MKNIKYIKVYKIKTENKTPLKVGSGKDENDILLDGTTSMPLIMGSSIAGAAKAYLRTIGFENDTLNKYLGNENSLEKDNNKKESKIYFFDVISKTKKTSEITRTRIDNKKGVAQEKSLFSELYLAEGNEFDLILKLFAKNKEELEKEIELADNIINGIYKGLIKIGSNKTAGYGIFEIINVKTQKYDFSKIEDIILYTNNTEKLIDSNSYKQVKVTNKSKILEARFCGEIKDSFISKVDVLNGEVDIESLSNIKGEYIIPGTTIKGSMRAYFRKILKTLDKEETEILNIMEKAFGNNPNNKNEAQMGRLYFENTKFDKNSTKECIYNMTKIDRFNGGVMTAALFQEKRIKGDVDIKVSFKMTDDQKINNIIIAMLYFYFRDLGTEVITLGGSTAVGSGKIIGEKFNINVKNKIMNFKFHNNKVSLDEKHQDYIKESINDLNQY